MKTNHTLPTIIAIGAAMTLSAANTKAISYELNAQPVSVALTLKFQVEGTFYFDTDENGKLVKVPSFDSFTEKYDKNDNLISSVNTQAAKVVAAKYGNAEILKELFEAGQLGDKVSGWAIVAIPDGSGVGGQYEIVARKKGEEDVPVAVSVSIEPGATAYTINDTISNKYDKDGNVTTTAGGSGAYAYDGVVSLDVSGEVSASAVGAITESLAEFRWYADPADKSAQESLIVSKGARIAGLVGTFDGGTVLGSASVGGGKATLVVE